MRPLARASGEEVDAKIDGQIKEELAGNHE